ncbi:hypothetical protein [Peterkaempfera griseoplana]|uniref:hypothetical protein n=1 Tax=Peterkaempfera griseoplana TaxID=66896 RepID=UPI0006E1281F|nr:hypothetical protein [Peterkaempfera griseoplana]
MTRFTQDPEGSDPGPEDSTEEPKDPDQHPANIPRGKRLKRYAHWLMVALTIGSLIIGDWSDIEHLRERHRPSHTVVTRPVMRVES